MPLARKSLIFGLHSIPANTTPVPLKNRLLSGFSLTMCFPPHMSAEKRKCGVNAAKIKFGVYQQTDLLFFNVLFKCLVLLGVCREHGLNVLALFAVKVVFGNARNLTRKENKGNKVRQRHKTVEGIV